VFLSSRKIGSQADANAKDAAIVASSLQHGVSVEVLRKALLRDSQGQPSGPLGAVLDVIAEDGPS